MVAVDGVTVMNANVGAVHCKNSVLTTLPLLAVMSDVPAFRHFANPPAVIVAVVVSPELQLSGLTATV